MHTVFHSLHSSSIVFSVFFFKLGLSSKDNDVSHSDYDNGGANLDQGTQANTYRWR
jgi:hypothetical protein